MKVLCNKKYDYLGLKKINGETFHMFANKLVVGDEIILLRTCRYVDDHNNTIKYFDKVSN